MNALERELRARMRAEGAVSFRDFMHAALYDPRYGYYATGRAWRGRGDFATAPAYGDAFARALARFLRLAREAMGPGRFEAVEVGAGSGRLAAQLHGLLAASGVALRAVEARRPPLLPDGVPWSASLEGLRVRGALLSNELFDALPVHLATRVRGEVRELWVVERGAALALEARAPSGPEVGAYLERFGIAPEEGHLVEVGLDALRLLRAMAASLAEGLLVTVDYGHGAREVLAQGPSGTLAAYRAHRLSPSVLAAPGEQDLTAHVNFTALEEEGRALGLETLASVPQWRFLAAMGAAEGIAAKLRGAGSLREVAEALAAKVLLVPGRMGDFRVLVQAKGLDQEAREAVARALAEP